MASEREKLVARHNASAPAAAVERAAMLREPFGAVGDAPTVKPRCACDYGFDIRAGRRPFVSAGSVVTRDVPAGKVAVGNPVRW